jgi:hypothetical protein
VFAAGGDARERERRRDRATASGGGIARGKTESGSLERERLRETWRETFHLNKERPTFQILCPTI